MINTSFDEMSDEIDGKKDGVKIAFEKKWLKWGRLYPVAAREQFHRVDD